MKLPIDFRGGPDDEATLRVIGLTSRATESIFYRWPAPVSLMNATDAELRARDLTPAQLRRLRRALDLATLLVSHPPGLDMPSADNLVDLFTPTLGFAEHEIFVVLALNARARLIQTTTVAVGTQLRVVVSPSLVFRDAIRAVASAVIVDHNHPSGDPSPSDDDILLTHRLARMGDLLGIEVYDHIIIGRPDRFRSLLGEGYITRALP